MRSSTRFPWAAVPQVPVGAGAARHRRADDLRDGRGQHERPRVITDTGSNLVAANALTGTTTTSSSSAAEERRQAVSRDSRRDALKDSSTKELQAAVEQQAQQRNAELAKLAKSAEKQAAKIALNAWGLPVPSYRLTAGFGQSSGLWANTHTGLDFAAPTGTPIHSVTNGTVTSVGYEGSYGNQVIVTTDEGEELWYCHMNQFASVRGRRGPHRRPPRVRRVHRQHHRPAPAPRVPPGAGDPVDPYDALVAHGLHP